MRIPTAAFIVAMALSACVDQTAQEITDDPRTPVKISGSDQRVIQRSLAAETMFPDRARVTGITASMTSKGVIGACGMVSSMEPAGFYGPSFPFIGILANSMDGQRVFAITKIGRTGIEQAAVLQLCEQYRSPILGGAVDDTAKIKRLLSDARELDRRCRGTDGADSTSTVCEKRNAKFTELNNHGWCYGKDGEYGYQHEWHVCGPTSVR